MKKLIYWTVLLLVLMGQSCSAPYHFDKFQKKGGKVNCVTDTLIVNDTLLINGDTVIVPREHYIIKDSIHYVTRFETKYMWKTIREQEKTDRTEIKQQGKTNRTETKQQGKTDRNDSDNNRRIENNLGNKVMSIFWAVLILVIGFFILRFAINQFKNRII